MPWEWLVGRGLHVLLPQCLSSSWMRLWDGTAPSYTGLPADLFKLGLSCVGLVFKERRGGRTTTRVRF